MGRLKLQTGINAIEEEPEECDVTYTNKTALACMINSEIGAVLAVMRRNVRWGGRYMSGDDQLEHSLIQSLKSLRKQIYSWQHPWHTINPAVYLQPFLDVVRSDETGAPITGVALSSVYKILTLDMIDQNTVNAGDSVHLIVDAVTCCRFELTDPASEEMVLMKILQVLLACMKSKASIMLSNQHVCTIVNTCFRIVHQAATKGELLQRIARHTVHELVRCIFSHLSEINTTERALVNGNSSSKQEAGRGANDDYVLGNRLLENGNVGHEFDGQSSSNNFDSNPSSGLMATGMEENLLEDGSAKDTVPFDFHLMNEPYGVPCMVEIFRFLCSLLNLVEHMELGARSNTMAFDEDVPLFALRLINSAIELGGPSFRHHPRLLSLIQDELFRNLMQFGLSTSSLILSMVCSIVLNLYHHLRTELKLQLEAFFSCVILRLAQSRYGASYQQQEVAMEALVDFCRQKTFMVEMYANLDCDITCSNVFEDLANLLSKSAFPVNCPLSSMHILALDGLIAVIQGMAERIGNGAGLENTPVNLEEYTPFWMVKCENYSDPTQWVPFVRRKKYIKRRLMIGADHFNRDPKKGLEFLQGTHLLPDKLDPKSVACFFRYTAGLDKNLVGDFLGNHDEFCVQVLHEFAWTFDFQDMNLDTALRLFLETFRLPGESQKIQRVLEAFSERYYEQSPQILVNKDAALLLSYSLIMLNTDQHNVQVKKKMTEEDFIRNSRHINGGNDLPRDFLSELYHSICKNEIRTTPEQGNGFPEMTPSRWIDLMHKSKKSSPFILDARVADAYCEQITQEVSRLVKANASHIRSPSGWRTITSLLSITARHPEASEAGFDALLFIVSDGAHLLPANYTLCIDASRQFAESRVGQAERSLRALDLMAGFFYCLGRWAKEGKEAAREEEAIKMSQDIGDMWLRLVQGLRKICLDQREEVRNQALLSLQKCLTGVDEINLPHDLWLQCFDLVIFTMLDDLLEIAQGHSQKDYRNMEGTLILAMKLLSKVFLLLLQDLSQLTTFCKLWLGVLSRMEKYAKAKVRGKRSEKLQELVPELLKNNLLVMKTKGVLVQRSALGGDSLWELTWLHVNNISPSLQSEVFPDQDSNRVLGQGEKGGLTSSEANSVSSTEKVASDNAGTGG
uniref:SEC7 domain-containing protein n=1 Tax=Cucumis sativus TaxID=3659 RepID=A0A0A0KNY2_CUCSA